MTYAQLFTLADAAAPAQNSQSMGGTTMIVYMACFGIILYYLMIRPQSQKQKQQAALIASVKTGDKVVFAGGILGMVANVKETTVIVKVADNVKLEVEKSSIVSVTKRSEDEALPAA